MNADTSLERKLRRVLARNTGWVIALAACGCDAQAANDYHGESMFRMRGRVELALDNASPNLVPALALVNSAEARVHFVGTSVTGEFPANFELEVYTPPPDAALGGFLTEDLPDEPRFTAGPIAAVTADHAAVAYLPGSSVAELQSCDGDSGVCTWTSQVQLERPNRVANITFTCPASHSEDPFASELECSVTDKSGDPVLGIIPDPDYPGFSQDYLVLYLESAASPDSYTAHLFGARETGLAAGYHLVSKRAQSMDEWIAGRRCSEDALAMAVERYNSEHGTAHGAETVQFSCEPDEDSRCGLSDSQLALRGAWYHAQVELGCSAGHFAYAPVDDTATTSITVHVAPGQVLQL